MIETARLRLRRWQAGDLAPFAALNADPQVMAHFPRTLTRGESDAVVARIEDHWRADGFCFAVAERRADRAFLGMVGLARLRLEGLAPCVEVGWRLAQAHWRQGYATEAAAAWLDLGFGAMGLAEIVAIAVPANTASLAVMRTLGMTEDPARRFVHPSLPLGHRLRPHVLHALTREAWQAQARPAATTTTAKREDTA